MDLPTVLVSAGLSGAVSWVIARQVAIRQTRAGSEESARRALRDLVAPEVRRLRLFARGLGSGRESRQGRTEDATFAAKVLATADDLSGWRRWLVRRRVRRLVGPVWWDIANLSPPEDDAAAFHVTLGLQLVAVRDERQGRAVERSGDLGRLHRAYCEPHDEVLVEQVLRDLVRLAAGR